MAKELLFHGKNPKGYIFKLEGDMEDFRERVEMLKTIDPDDEDYGINHCYKNHDNTESFTQEERDKDLAELDALVARIENEGWKEIFMELPRKKNGSLYKNRVKCLWRGETFQRYWEDSYGYNAPEFSIKSIDDYTAVLEVTERVVGY